MFAGVDKDPIISGDPRNEKIYWTCKFPTPARIINHKMEYFFPWLDPFAILHSRPLMLRWQNKLLYFLLPS